MYKLCALSKTKGWVEIKIPNDLDEIHSIIEEEITAKDYYSYVLKERKNNTDSVIETKQLYEKCEIEYSDNVKTRFEVKITTFNSSRAKEKQQLRKMTEEYLK